MVLRHHPNRGIVSHKSGSRFMNGARRALHRVEPRVTRQKKETCSVVIARTQFKSQGQIGPVDMRDVVRLQKTACDTITFPAVAEISRTGTTWTGRALLVSIWQNCIMKFEMCLAYSRWMLQGRALMLLEYMESSWHRRSIFLKSDGHNCDRRWLSRSAEDGLGYTLVNEINLFGKGELVHPCATGERRCRFSRCCRQVVPRTIRATFIIAGRTGAAFGRSHDDPSSAAPV